MTNIFNWLTNNITNSTLETIFWLGMAFLCGWLLSSADILPDLIN